MRLELPRFIASSTAGLRTSRGKLSLISQGKLTVSRLVKYAIRGNDQIREAAMQYILDHPEFHAEAVTHLTAYLSSDVHINEAKVNNEGAMPQHRKDGSVLDVPVIRYVVMAMYPERISTQEALRAIQSFSQDQGVKTRIEDIFRWALPTQELVRSYSMQWWFNKS